MRNTRNANTKHTQHQCETHSKHRPDKCSCGSCYKYVAQYVANTGYGNIPRFGFSLPQQYFRYARHFADYMNDLSPGGLGR
jgi:hypothetical protein